LGPKESIPGIGERHKKNQEELSPRTGACFAEGENESGEKNATLKDALRQFGLRA